MNLSIRIAFSLAGIFIAVITQRLMNRRGLFTYNVIYNPVGLSAEDETYGSVKVTLNDMPVSHLYLSTVELINQSIKDFDSVIVRVFTNKTALLSQKTEIVGTTRIIDFTEKYKTEIAVPKGGQPTESQITLYRRRRDYFIPTMNRGQILRFQFLNDASPHEHPFIFLEVMHKGVKCEFKAPPTQFLGVSQNQAALAGTLVGLIAIGFVITYVKTLPLVALLAFFIGWLVIIPGAYTIKAWEKVRKWVAG